MATAMVIKMVPEVMETETKALITPAEEDGEGGAGGGAGGGNAGVAADPGVGGGAGGGVAAAPPAGFGGLGGGLMSCFKSGKTLTLTSLHLLPFDDCEALNEAHLNVEDIDTFMRQSKFAHKAVAGQCVISVTPSGILSIDRIISVNRRVSKGIYSPMTVEGSIIANGILSSCFSQLESHAVQKLAYDALVGIYNIFGYLQDAIVEPTQEIPSMLNYIHQLSRFVLPFSKY
uniref:Hint domain-containing protein n=2 Tax=Panagrolaimus superbus TaxID=310955 RepID=A0A914YJA9_9BILA